MSSSRITGTVVGTRVDVTTMPAVIERIFDLSARGQPAYVCFATTHMLIEAKRQPAVHAAYENATMVTPDGTPVAWCLRLMGHSKAQCVSGPRLVPKLLESAAMRGIPVGFYGGRPETLQRMRSVLETQHPALKIAYMCSPPFRALEPGERAEIIQNIRDSGARIVLVGLGSPKQERWMLESSVSFDCTLLGVGAVFEFLSGEKVMPPEWVQKLGLTWLVRLLQEPRRLAKRNFYYSPLFVVHFMRQWWGAFAGIRKARRAEL
jgi:N-acetylglucosaminyldiphosphoundecaprenol N-acetyl-beta-D-mannosaminyltransferase